jgi:hypothetical protein
MGRFLLTQMASVAELEAGLISERTKAALAAAKARGVKLGNPNGARALQGKQEEHLSKLTVDEACNPPKLGGCGYRGLLERRQLPLSNSPQPARLPHTRRSSLGKGRDRRCLRSCLVRPAPSDLKNN